MAEDNGRSAGEPAKKRGKFSQPNSPAGGGGDRDCMDTRVVEAVPREDADPIALSQQRDAPSGGVAGVAAKGSGGAIGYGAGATVPAPPTGGGKIVSAAAAAAPPDSRQNNAAPRVNAVVKDFKGDLSKERGLLVSGCGIAEVNGTYHGESNWRK